MIAFLMIIGNIVRNLSYNTYNKRKGLVLLEHDEVKRLPNNEKIIIEEQLLKIDFSLDLAKYLDRLHLPYADILTLRFYYEAESVEKNK